MLHCGALREPATAITDFVLAALALSFFLALWRASGKRLIGAPIFFAGFACAAACGGTWHGFFSADSSQTQRLVWWATQAFTGVSAAGLTILGLECFGWRRRSSLLVVAVVISAAVGLYAWYDDRFFVSVVATGIATLICLAGLYAYGRRVRHAGAGLVAGGLVLSIVAAVLQQRGVAIDPAHFDHNATYHVWLIVSLILIYAGSRRIARQDS